ncbi:e5122a6c-5659-43f3-9460-c2c5e2bb7ecc [Sclerotinia trifoliorum]|uniref:E5122a6c-5659-43f3-9460-c2c5e2bb7ecc n=1 Tax=Sclerotinia trifoliorum TaxID=28548 RepID=A0A8H2VPZ5_9HELO|nr:e5122a6c-5659-43f3-9460-c2c5e2bb7ecc [Sclerotinia trifoliorum]
MSSTTNHIRKNHLNSRACKTCALAKAKCVPRTEGLNTKCERCHRLKKDCARQTPSIKVRKPYKATRVAQLEEKIDGIVSLLQQQKSVNSQDTTSGNSPLITNEDIPPRSPLTDPEPPSRPVTNGIIPHLSPKSLEPSKRQSVYEKSTNACLLAHVNSNLEPSDVEIERLVKLYQTEMAAKFPFVVIETGGLTRKGWVLEKPVLGKAILMAASYYNLPRQTVYETALVRDLTDRIMVKRERTLELLQAILIFCGWYHYHCLGHPHLNNLLGLAMGLAGDLGLNKPPSLDKFKYPFGHSRATAGDFSRRSMEQRRALAGLFYLTSLVATGFQRIDAMKYSIHLDECIRVIEENPEYSTDLLLVELVKVSHLGERISQTVSVIQNESEIQIPTALNLGLFQTQLDTLKKEISGPCKDDVILQLHHHLSAIRLHEVALTNNWTPKIATQSPQSTSTTRAIHPPPLHPSHIQSLYTCLHHTRSFLSLISSLPPSTYLSQPITPWFLLAYALMILARLSFYQNPLLPTWTLDFVREICDLSSTLEELANRNENAKYVDIDLITREDREFGLNAEVDVEGRIVGEGWTDCFDKFARKIKLVKCWYDQKVAGYRGAAASVSMPLGGWLRADKNAMECGNGGINEDITQEGTQVNSNVLPILGETDTNPWNRFEDQNFWMDLDGEWWDIEGLEAMSGVF